MKKTNKDTEILSITQIKIKLSDKKEISLSSEKTRQVYEELGKLFKLEEKSEIEKYKELLEEWDEKYEKKIPYIPYPIYIEKNPIWPIWKQWEITCEKPIWIVDQSQLPTYDTTCLSINLTSNS